MDDGQRLLERILDGAEDPTDLPLALLKHLTDDFSNDRRIGQGGFGAIYKGILGERNVAVKRIYVNLENIDDDDKQFGREINSLWNTSHRNVVQFLGFCSNIHQKRVTKDRNMVLASVRERLFCFEYISNGSLDKHITDELRGFQWETRYEIITGICNGLRYLHEEKSIIHMDLKPANILLDHQHDKYMVPKITDFGLSRPNENSHTVGKVYGTRGYLAPEYENNGKTSFKSDIYSLGLIIIELVTGCKDVPIEDNVLRRWRHRWNKPPTQLQYQQVTRCIDIAERCRKQQPEARPSILEIIRFLSESESTYGQISPSLDEDNMLRINPLELRLPSELKNEISCSVELSNGTRNCIIAFNIQLPSAQYSAQPIRGIVQPGSTYAIIIKVQARDVREHNHSDKFIVQSMQVEVSENLRDEDIPERLSRAEAVKVVDEVDLMVLYQTMKPQENPAEEVTEEKKRNIVESVSRKGKNKLGSSENVQATCTDISSSVRGQCTAQTEQCNLHTLQSFSRHYRTSRKYLMRESEAAVDHARGALGSLLDKLGKLVTGDYSLDRSIKRNIETFSENLRNMHRDLPKLENVDGAKDWVDEVRELSYHVEDMVDCFLVHVEPDSDRSGFKELKHDRLNLLVNGMPTHYQIDDVIRDIKDKVQAVANRKENYNIDVKDVVANPTVKAAIEDLRNSAIYEDVEEKLVGIEAPIEEMMTLLNKDGNVPKENHRVISIVGFGGLGKTTLAKAIYDRMKAYDLKAFVHVGQNPDVKTVLKNIIFELKEDFNREKLNVCQLIKTLKELLKNKRYLLVLDGIWDSSSWGVIKSAFPENKNGSRVIITTRDHDVALACCHAESEYVYTIKPLSDEDSRRLFFGITFGPRKDGADTPRKEEISEYILKRCGGIPLAINIIAKLLAGKVESTWEYVWKCLDAMTEGDGLEITKQILDFSYSHLPDHLKKCLLYACKYPEDREIDKNDLLRQWVTEGFVSTNGQLDAEDVAENYFKALVNMCMIQPGKIDHKNEVLSCRVHDLILDLMRSKSSEENLSQIIDGLKDETEARGEIRRVSVHRSVKEDSCIIATISEPKHKGLKLLVNGMPTHYQINDVMRDIKDNVQAVANRKENYNIDVKGTVANTTVKAAIDDLRNSAIYEDVEEKLVGIEAPREELIRLLKKDGNVPKENLGVVSIFGMTGLGKTTLAKAVYDNLKAYDLIAFVPVGQNTDVKTVLKNIIFEVKEDFNAENMNMGQLIKTLKELLKNKRYLIVIDDIWDSSSWGVIKSAFPENKNGSRVIITTRDHDVALACCHPESEYVYVIQPLSDEESRRLFFGRTFGPGKKRPDTPRKEEISEYIMKKCGGMPLAINSIARRLAGKVQSTWEYVWKCLDAMSEGDGLEITKQILDLSYIHLPDHLKTCLLYACKYLEDREIDKNDLLRQWVAEGFMSTNGQLDPEDVAEEYFKKLISVCMIQPGKIDYNNEVLSCRVHDIILELMRSKSSEENFIQIIDGLKDETGARGEIRRLSVHHSVKEDSSILAKIKGSLSHVRSVLLYRGSLVPYFLVFKYIRVLHIEDRNFSNGLDLTGISRLFLLRYLKVAGSDRSDCELKLPNQIGELQQLETIDLEGGEVKNYPSDIVSLPRLSHLSYGRPCGVVLPDGIDRLKSLCTLEGVCVYKSSVDNIKGLGELTNLRNLRIGSYVFQSMEADVVRMNALHSSISRLSTSLRILTVRSNVHILKLDLSRTLFPQGSYIRKLELTSSNFQKCPEWIGQLHNLYSFHIRVREVADGVIIAAGLPSLAYYRLDACVGAKEESVVISGHGAFRALKHLYFGCTKASLTFEEGALPKLENLDIKFRYHMARRFLPVGIKHLPARTLHVITLHVSRDNSEVKGSEDWDTDGWEGYWSSDEYRDKVRKHTRKMRPLLKRAFKAHHPGAEIGIDFEDKYHNEEDDDGVDDEENYYNEDDDGSDDED